MQELLLGLGPIAFFSGKILVLAFLAIYLVFAFVVVKQVQLMTKTLELGLEGVIAVFAYLHLLFAFAIFVISLIML